MVAVFFIFLVVAFLIAMNFLYVAAEFASVKARKTRLNQIAESGNGTAQMLLPMIDAGDAIDNYVAACQIGITISSLSLGAYGQNVLAKELAPLIAPITTSLGWDSGVAAAASEGSALLIATWSTLAIITILQVVVGELIPKSLAIQRPEKWAVNTTYLMKLSIWLYTGLIWLLNGSGNRILKWLGLDHHGGHGHLHSAKEIEMLVEESAEAGILDDEERQMLRNTFRLKELTARQVMVHRTRLVAAPIDSTVASLIQLALKYGYTRIPVYRDNVDQIAGIVHIKDLFQLHNENVTTVKARLRDVTFVPESLPVPDVWETLRKSGQYMVIVFDEYGGTAGIITLEDLIEEIFGELQDEFDEELALFAEDAMGRYYLRGDLLVSDINEYLEMNLPLDIADSLSGLLFHASDGSPKEGMEVEIAGTAFRIEKVDDLTISEISFSNPDIDISSLVEWEVASYE